MSGVAAAYERICRAVLIVIVVNIAMILHTLLGLVVFGFFPSIAAACAVFRSWLIAKDRSWSIRTTFSVFNQAWTEEMTGANLFGWSSSLIAGFLAWDYFLVNWNDLGGVVGVAISGLMLVINVIFALTVLVTWGLRAHVEASWWEYLRMSVEVLLGRPVFALMLIALLGLTGFSWIHWPGICAALGLSLPLFATMAAMYSFAKIPGLDAKQVEAVV